MSEKTIRDKALDIRHIAIKCRRCEGFIEWDINGFPVCHYKNTNFLLWEMAEKEHPFPPECKYPERDADEKANNDTPHD